jgi:D-alanyl-D-alanine carboxypeptidase
MKSFWTSLSAIALLTAVTLSGSILSGQEAQAPDEAVKELPPVEAAIVGGIPEMPTLPNFFTLPPSELAGPRGPVRNNDVPDYESNARAVFAITDRGEVLYENNADEVLPIASITKLMTALVATGRLEYTEPVTVSAEAIATDGDLGELITGDTFSLHDILMAMLLPSSNDAATAIAEALGGEEWTVALMNAEAQNRGWSTAVFRNPHGLTPGGNDMTARDVAGMLFAALDDPTLAAILQQHQVRVESAVGNNYTWTHRGNGLTQFPGFLGAKTGYTDESLGTLAFAFQPDVNSDRKVAIVVLGSLDRSGDVESLARWIQAAYEFPQTEIQE